MRETILVVDDEPVVLRIVCSILSRGGYRVLEAGSPQEALRLARETAEPIHLLVCDVIMPGLSGPTVAEQFAELHPETQCIFIAGLPDSPEVYERIIRPGKILLPKPFVPGTLLSKVRQVLGGEPARVA